jgi:hypothetical protein
MNEDAKFYIGLFGTFGAILLAAPTYDTVGEMLTRPKQERPIYAYEIGQKRIWTSGVPRWVRHMDYVFVRPFGEPRGHPELWGGKLLAQLLGKICASCVLAVERHAKTFDRAFLQTLLLGRLLDEAKLSRLFDEKVAAAS